MPHETPTMVNHNLVTESDMAMYPYQKVIIEGTLYIFVLLNGPMTASIELN